MTKENTGNNKNKKYQYRDTETGEIIEEVHEWLDDYVKYYPPMYISRKDNYAEATVYNNKRILKKEPIIDNVTYIVIENFNGCINFVTDSNSGDVLVFTTYSKAEEEAKKYQNGKVVKL